MWAGTGSSLNTQGNEPGRNSGLLTSASTLTFTGESADIETGVYQLYISKKGNYKMCVSLQKTWPIYKQYLI